MTSDRGREGAVVLGLVAPSGIPRGLADHIAVRLPGRLGNRVGEVTWQVRVADAERADATPGRRGALPQAVRRRMQDKGWDRAVG